MQDLYAGKLKAYIEVQMPNGQVVDLDVDMIGADGEPDCCIGHFGYNMYIRTPYGMKRKHYVSLQTLITACGRIVFKNSLKPLRFLLRTSDRTCIYAKHYK